jgi:hypothetical protein
VCLRKPKPLSPNQERPLPASGWIDIHVHTCVRRGPLRPDGETYATPQQLIEMFDQRGIERAVILPGASPECAHHSLSVDECLAVCQEHPDRFIPFCNVDPRMLTNSPRANFTPMLEHWQDLGCRGVGELCANLPFIDPRVQNLLEHCELAALPVTFHVATQLGGTYGLCDDLGLPQLEICLERFPHLVFLGHSQAFWSEISGDVTDATRGGYPDGPVADGGRVSELMREYPNLCGDLSANSGYNALARDPAFGYAFIEEFQDGLLFGTDICSPTNQTPLVDFLRDAVEAGHISREAFEKVTRRNAAHLLALDREGEPHVP